MIEVLRDPYFWQVLGLSMGPFVVMLVIALVFGWGRAAEFEVEGPDSRFNLSARTIATVRLVRRFVIWPGITVSMLLAFGLGMVEVQTGPFAFWTVKQVTIEVPSLVGPFTVSPAQIAAFCLAQVLVVAFWVSLWAVRRGPGEPDYDAYAD